MADNRYLGRGTLAIALLVALLAPMAGCARPTASLSSFASTTEDTDAGVGDKGVAVDITEAKADDLLFESDDVAPDEDVTASEGDGDSSVNDAASFVRQAASSAEDGTASEEDDTTPEVDAVSQAKTLGPAHSVDDTLMAPYGTTVLGVTDEGVQIYWKRPEGAEGYEVACAYAADDEPKRIARLPKGTFTYTDDTFDHNRQTVYYFVRMVVARGDEVVASPWSEPIEAAYEEGIKLSRETWYLPSGDTYQLEACHGWESAHDATWTSSNEAVATVDQTGLIEGLSAGVTEVTCAVESLGLSATATIEVDRDEAIMLSEPNPRYTQSLDGVWRSVSAQDTQDALIVIAGDLMCMKPQQNRQYSEERGYVFNESFDYVTRLFGESDLAVGNLETMLASAYPYNRESGYLNGKPVCNAPARYLDALRYAGFDLLCMANNHNADTGVRGVPMTIKQVDRYLFAHTGLFATEDDERTLLVEVNGIKVGFVAYVDKTCSFNGQDSSWTQEQRDILLNYYSAERAAADIAQLRERGAEYIIAYLHWGIKNHFDPAQGQINTASEIANLGVDYIVGSHPHLVQHYEVLETEAGRLVPCIYSIGDFNSNINQVEGNLDSIVMRLRLKRAEDGTVQLVENNYVPCHIYRSYGERHYVSMPLDAALNGGASMPGAARFRERIAAQVGEGLPVYEP